MPVSRYSRIAIALHWAIAILIVANLWLGWSYAEASGMAKFDLMQWHKSLGITVLVLSVARLIWRLVNRPSALPDYVAGWQKLAAAVVHWCFYGLMIALPLTGWIIVSASLTNIPTLLYKTVAWPHIGIIHAMEPGQRRAVEAMVGDIHYLLVWGAVGLIALHLGAVLKHSLLDRHHLILRMIPDFRRPHS